MQLKRTAQMLGTVQKRQLGRKRQILHTLATCFLCKITDAPHTGARLETLRFRFSLAFSYDAPHTGARLETIILCALFLLLAMMPPTRGHDLKLQIGRHAIFEGSDAPHTGARLETCKAGILSHRSLQDAPHTGARLETSSPSCSKMARTDAPHTGARLETDGRCQDQRHIARCPPHGGTT